MTSVVTLDVWRVPVQRLPRVTWRMAVDRRALRRTPGVGFVKLLGTSRDLCFGPGSADPTRWAALVAWHGRDTAGRQRLAQWDAIAAARCRLTLRPLGSRGAWGGRAPFTVEPEPAASRVEAGPVPFDDGPALPVEAAPAPDGPVLALTRARLRARSAAEFWRAVAPVAVAVARAPGLLATFGIGEAPLGWQGTVSVWRESSDLRAFAYRHPGHTSVIAAAPARRWYVEELFARFAVVDIAGERDVIGWREVSLR